MKVRRLPVFFVVFIGLFASSCAGTYSMRERQSVPEDFFGIIDGIDNSERKSAFLTSLGVSWVRADFTWAWIEMTPGQWDFQQFDDYLQNSDAADRKVLGILDYSVPWLFEEEGYRHYVARKDLPHFLNYVRALAERYKGRIGAWEVWNEPNSPIFWRGPTGDFFELTKQTVRAIREIDREVPVLVGSTFTVPRDWIRSLRAYGAMEGASGFSFHPYWVNDDNAVYFMDQAIEAMEEIGFTGELWISEMGFPTGGWYPSSVSEREQASRLTKVYAVAAAKGIKKVFWYRIQEGYLKGKAPDPLNSEDFFGLAFPDYSEKPAAQAYRKLSGILSGAVYDPGLARIEDGDARSLVLLPFYKDGLLRIVAWTRGGSEVFLAFADRDTETRYLGEEARGKSSGSGLELSADPGIFAFSFEDGRPLNFLEPKSL